MGGEERRRSDDSGQSGERRRKRKNRSCCELRREENDESSGIKSRARARARETIGRSRWWRSVARSREQKSVRWQPMRRERRNRFTKPGAPPTWMSAHPSFSFFFSSRGPSCCRFSCCRLPLLSSFLYSPLYCHVDFTYPPSLPRLSLTCIHLVPVNERFQMFIPIFLSLPLFVSINVLPNTQRCAATVFVTLFCPLLTYLPSFFYTIRHLPRRIDRWHKLSRWIGSRCSIFAGLCMLPFILFENHPQVQFTDCHASFSNDCIIFEIVGHLL